ncbi:hypothetical protein KUTeg_017289 [Tegillarca granosa]|uniref:Uncharacterized protein n=1 Tax=Tegillarca granosa TaxID=220873 RepID=A0ABQ9EIQ3_TEGGR|nr:hypothetical protein KUTeg_017289 [Tegillarca granosa]
MVRRLFLGHVVRSSEKRYSIVQESCGALDLSSYWAHSYIALIPKVLRPGLPLNVTVTVFNTQPGKPDVFVRAELINKTDYKALAVADEVIRKDVPGTIKLNAGYLCSFKGICFTMSDKVAVILALHYFLRPIDTLQALPVSNVPKDLISTGQYHVTLHGLGGLHFSDGADIEYEQKHISIFIQTDKAVYKAGQTVHFRTFALHPNGKVSLNKMDIKIYASTKFDYIQDPKDNKIKQILGAQEAEYGVVTGSMIMDEKPTLGQWKIKVSTEVSSTVLFSLHFDKPFKDRVASSRFMGYTSQKMFKVAEYVLPKYKVELDIPPYALTTDREISGTVTAKSVIIHGEAKFTIPLEKLQEMTSTYQLIGDVVAGKHLLVTAVVTEKLNNMTMNDSTSVEIRKSSLDLKFPSNAKTSFIPGLTYTARVQLAEADGRPPMGHLQQLQFTVYAKYSHGFTSDWPGVKVVKFLEKTYRVPPTGLLNIDLELPTNATQAKYEDMERELFVTPLQDSYIHSQLNLLSSRHVAGGIASFRLKTTRPLNGTFYQSKHKGNAVKTGYINLQNNLTAYFDIEITPDMAPISKVILYYLEQQSGQIFADSATINVEGTLRNKVSLNFNATTAKPGECIDLDVSADPNSMVNVLAVDQSVMLLGSGNDISESEVISELSGYTPPAATYLYFYHPHNHQYGSHMTHNKLYPGYRFDESGTLVLTDASAYDHASYKSHSDSNINQLVRGQHSIIAIIIIEHSRLCRVYHYTVRSDTYESYPYKRSSSRLSHYKQLLARQAGCVCPGGSSGSFGPFPGLPGTTALTPYIPTPVPGMTLAPGFLPTMPPLAYQTFFRPTQAPLKKVEKMRTEFPETWLWINKTTGSDGHVHFTTKAPDSITSWIASAFAVNKNSGIGLSSSSAQLQTFRPFFISLNLPYSVVRGEELVLQANVLVTFEKSEDFRNIIITDAVGTQQYVSRTQTETVNIKAGEATSVYFPIVPAEIGKIDISVKAQSSVAADGVKRKLLVEKCSNKAMDILHRF